MRRREPSPQDAMAQRHGRLLFARHGLRREGFPAEILAVASGSPPARLIHVAVIGSADIATFCAHLQNDT